MFKVLGNKQSKMEKKAVIWSAGENELAVYNANAPIVVDKLAVSSLPAGCNRE